MGVFSGRRKAKAGQIIGAGQLAELDNVGRLAFADPPQVVDVTLFYLPGYEAAGFPTDEAGWDRFVQRFIGELMDAARAQGGWSQPGALHVALDFVKSTDWAKPQLVELGEIGLRYLLSQGVPTAVIPNRMTTRYVELQNP